MNVYSTLAAKMFQSDLLRRQAKEGVEALLYRDSDQWKWVRGVITPSHLNADFPFLPHPMTVTVDDENWLTVADLRNYLDKNGEMRDLYNLAQQLTLAKLVGTWEREPNDFGSVARIASVVFGNWVSATLSGSRVYNLDMNERSLVKGLAAMFYHKLFLTHSMGDRYRQHDAEYALTATLKHRALMLSDAHIEVLMSDETVQLWLETNNHGTTELMDLLSMIKRVLSEGSFQRFQSLDGPSFVRLMLPGAWIGNRSELIVGASVEYMPYMVSMINVAMENARLREKTNIGRAVATVAKSNDIVTLQRLVKEITDDRSR